MQAGRVLFVYQAMLSRHVRYSRWCAGGSWAQPCGAWAAAILWTVPCRAVLCRAVLLLSSVEVAQQSCDDWQQGYRRELVV